MTSSDRSDLEGRVAALRRLVYGTPDGHLSDAVAELEAAEAELARSIAAERAEGPSSTPTAGVAAGRAGADLPGTDPTDQGSPGAGPPAGDRSTGELTLLDVLEQADLADGAEWASGGRGRATDARAADAGATEAGMPDVDAADGSRRRGARSGARRRTLLFGAVAAIGVVALLGPMRALAEPPRGLEVFDRAPDPSQAMMPGENEILTPESLASVRFIGTEVGYDAWVFRDRNDVCMTLQRENWYGSGTTCVAEADFARTGIRQVVRYEQLYDLVRPVGVGPGDGVEFAWTADSTALEWSMRR
ncbi:hypothetical protein [Agromyces aureus]|uniref:Uncharacterized protein n=1 Tax=Agromyces aureus TaxID=453304 RepID=A0A191WC91_9MICO|nr:hypothetical protein [Agromyces aureus]ANJ25799.1 hypothetical protein ATC03_02535 [Agromyces aureus]